MRKLSLIVFLIPGLLLLSACSPSSGGPPSQDDIGTAVASTMQALETSNAIGQVVTEDESKIVISTTPPQIDEDYPTPIPPPEEFHLAFTDAGDVWLIRGSAPPVRLTTDGGVTRIRLSSDGAYVAFSHHDAEQDTYSLHAVDTASGEEMTLFSQSDLDQLYMNEKVRHTTPSQFEFIPETHILLLNTTSIFEGPGQMKNDDLLHYNLASGKRTTLLPPGMGGDFTISPDGRWLAIIRSDGVSFSNINGAELHSDVLNFEPVITYSEFKFYPIPSWSEDSSRFAVVIPSPDPFAPDVEAKTWTVPVDGAPPVDEGMILGQTYFPQLSGHPLVSDDLSRLIFFRSTGVANVSELYFANLDGSSEVAYTDGEVQWAGWHPDSNRFVFGYGPMDLQIGSVGQPPSPLVEGIDLRWLNDSEYIYLVGKYGDWTIMRSEVGGSRIPLVSPSGEFVEYDFAQ